MSIFPSSIERNELTSAPPPKQPQASTSKLPITSSSSRPVSYTSKTSRRPASPSSPIVNLGVMELLSDSDTSDLDDDNAPRRRSPSPELYGDQPPYPSSSTSPSGDESTRRSNRKTTQVEFVGNLVDHTPEMCRGVPVEPSPTKRRKVDKSYALSLGPKKGNGDGNGNGDGDGKGKGKRKEKAAEEEENSEVKLPLCVLSFSPPILARAHSCLRAAFHPMSPLEPLASSIRALSEPIPLMTCRSSSMKTMRRSAVFRSSSGGGRRRRQRSARRWVREMASTIFGGIRGKPGRT